MSLKYQVKNFIKNILEEEGIVLEEGQDFQVEVPQKDFGDLATNVAFVAFPLLKEKFKNPQLFAEFLAKIFSEKDKKEMFAAIKACGGFINFVFSPQFIQAKLEEILKEKNNYGRLDIGKGKRVQVEFISANPTGPLTLGNARGAFLGDSLARILEFLGFEVEREYFVNNLGHQIEVLGYSVLQSLGYLETEEVYRGEYIGKVAENLIKEVGQEKIETLSPFEIGKMAAQLILEDFIQKTIDRLGIKFDRFTFEEEMYEKHYDIEVLKILKEKNLIYEKDGAVFFASSQFGDEKDRVLYRQNGLPTYFASDAAYHFYKFGVKNYDLVVNLWGADHHGYVKRVEAVVEALGFSKEKLKVIVFQLVRLVEDGREVRMSKRKGEFVTLDELLDEVPYDVCRFFFLMYSPSTHMDFDLKLAKEKSMKNPVYYFQYAYVRALNILRKAPLTAGGADLSLLSSETEIDLAKELLRFQDIVLEGAQELKAHHLTQWALSLAKKFHNFYESEKIITQDKEKEPLMAARLALVEATKYIFENLAFLLGISLPEKM